MQAATAGRLSPAVSLGASLARGIVSAAKTCGVRGNNLNSRERLTAASRGGETDRLPWFVWKPQSLFTDVSDLAENWQPDALVVATPEDARELLQAFPDSAILVEVGNPFGAALLDGIDLNDEFEKGPAVGSHAFDKYVAATQELMESAMDSGADGILYRVFGAEPNLSTPMQFGGFYLEQERELLSGVADARFNVVYIEGGEGTYLDVVSDLTSHALGWDEMRSAIPASEVRAMHRGALACGLHVEDPQRLFASIGKTGLILSGKVEDFSTYDFTNVVSASRSLAEAMR